MNSHGSKRDQRTPGRRIVSLVSALALALGLFTGRPDESSAKLHATVVTPAGGAAPEVRPALPLTFEKNVGQTDARVKYVARGRGYAVFVAEDGVVLSLSGRGDRANAVRMAVAGARAGSIVEGEAPLPGTANYMIGSDPSAWRTEIPTYGRVRRNGLLPGVDLALYGTDRQLEYDLVVAPGADPASLEVRFDGVDEVTVDETSGDAILRVGEAEIRQRPAVVYQMVGGKKRSVASRYVERGGGSVGFHVGSYDTSAPLVVDPVLVFSTYFGGDLSGYEGYEGGYDIAVDSAGSAYVTGFVDSVNFPTTAGAYDRTYNFGQDAFVTKLSPNGSSLVYSAYLGSSVIDVPNAIAVDSSGAAYVVGRTGSDSFGAPPSDFPTTPGAFDRTYRGEIDGFVAKLNPAGTALTYSTFFGASGLDEIFDVAVDASGAAYVVGRTSGRSDFVTTPGAFDRTPNGELDGFVAKFTPDGGSLVYSTFLGASSNDEVRGVVVDASGAAYLAGYTFATSGPNLFPATAGAFDVTHNGQGDAFAAKLDAQGASLGYATFLGGTSSETAYDVVVDSLGSAYVAGTTISDDFPTTAGALDTTRGSGNDGYVTKLNAAGTALAYSTFFGLNGSEYLYGIAIDATRSVYVTGQGNGVQVTGGAFDQTANGGYDAFCAKISASGSALLYSTYLGGMGDDVAYGIAVDGNGNAYVTGSTISSPGSPAYPTTSGAFDPTYNGELDAFVTKVNAAGSALVYSTVLGGKQMSFYESGRAIAVDQAGNRYVAGITTSLNFPTTPGAYDTTLPDPLMIPTYEAFVTKTDPSGTSLLYSTFLGGTSEETPTSLEVDAAGAAYVAGYTRSTNFPLTPGAADTTSQGSQEGFVTKLSPSGSALLLSTYVGGLSTDILGGIDVDTQGNVYAVGFTDSDDFPVTPGAYDTTFATNPNFSATDGFVVKLNGNGTTFVYSTYIGGQSYDYLRDAVVDASGALYVVGATESLDYPTTPGAFDTTIGPGNRDNDAVVTRLSPSGASIEVSTFLGADGHDEGVALARDRSGAVYVAGIAGQNFPTTPGAYQRTRGEFFVSKLDANLTSLVYSTMLAYIGGFNDLTDLAVTSAGAAVISATFDRPYPTTPDAFDTTHNGGEDAVVTMLRPDGGALLYSTVLGGAQDDIAYGLAVDGADAIYLVGETQSIAFPTVAPYSANRRGGFDAFVAKFTPFATGDSPAIVVGSTGAWFLKNANEGGPADAAFTFGAPGSGAVPIAGDWNADGIDTIGLYDSSTGAFFLKNTSASGDADVVFTFGAGGSGLLPLVGDWDGDGTDTVGLYVVATGVFFLKNTNAPGAADLVLSFGPGGAGITPVTGDWNGDGVDTVGIYVGSTGTFFLRNSNTPGSADVTVGFGPANATPLGGDWNGDGVDTVGVYVPSTGAWFLRNSNQPGPADIAFSYGPVGTTPLIGNWDGQ